MRTIHRFTTAAWLSLALALPSYANIESADDPVFGPDTITRDTDTGLEWLDLTLTTGKSYNEVAGEFGPGGDFEGWRHATGAEIMTFWTNAGIAPNAAFRSGAPGDVAVRALQGLLGITATGFGGELTAGDYDDTDTGSTADVGDAALHADAPQLPDPYVTLTYLRPDRRDPDDGDASDGQWLVRDTAVPPSPATVSWCAGANLVTATVDAGDEFFAFCGSFGIKVTKGVVGLAFEFHGQLATAEVSAGNALAYDTTANELSTPAANVGTVSVEVAGQTIELGPGGTFADTTPPTLTVPPSVILEATSANGATHTFSATATDAVDPSPVVSCSPASGTTFGLGTTTVTCTATDFAGNSTSGSFTVTVRDTTPPTIESVTASPDVLSPPNRKMRAVRVTVVATDVVDPAPGCRITGVSSNQPASPGTKSADWVINDDLSVELRADRSGKGGERVYTVSVRCTDASGNSTDATVEVRVRHDERTDK